MNVDEFDEAARGELARLYALARRLVDDEAEDLVQECLLRAFRGRCGLQGPPGPWFRAILLNCLRDRFRRQGRSPRTVSVDEVDTFSLYQVIATEDPLPYSDSLHLDFLGAFEEEDVQRVLARLPLLYRAPLVLRYLEEMATKDVAAALGVPQGTALARLHRGRKLLERELWAYARSTGLLERTQPQEVQR